MVFLNDKAPVFKHTSDLIVLILQPTHSAPKITTPKEDQASNTMNDHSILHSLTDKVEFSLTQSLNIDPMARQDGQDHHPREVHSGHYVPVAPTPLADPAYVSHSSILFQELGFPEELSQNDDFHRIFSGDLSSPPAPFKPVGWATGYALSIYGTEYTQQCPFQTGNGYGDGRAISVCEVVNNDKRWELQLKGGGPTPYCRGGDGRAVLRSSVREFLAQEFMHALGVPSSRSLSLFVSQTETVQRPWYANGSSSFNPDIMVDNPVAISTRVAPSFIRVGQLELFARRARVNAHPTALDELRSLVEHAIEREYAGDIDRNLPFSEQIIDFAISFRQRLMNLVTQWLRVGYCQGNFNSDNCAVGGFTLDYGPFGFCEFFDPYFQPWTGGGQHFSLFNQPLAAEANYQMFCQSLMPLLPEDSSAEHQLNLLQEEFSSLVQEHINTMWAQKLGLSAVSPPEMLEFWQLMSAAPTDFTILFRQLSEVPDDSDALGPAFLHKPTPDLNRRWHQWFTNWRMKVKQQHGSDVTALSQYMQQTNPRYTWREWQVAPAYQQAADGDYGLLRQLQELYANPYHFQNSVLAQAAYRHKPAELANRGGISHYSCSS